MLPGATVRYRWDEQSRTDPKPNIVIESATLGVSADYFDTMVVGGSAEARTTSNYHGVGEVKSAADDPGVALPIGVHAVPPTGALMWIFRLVSCVALPIGGLVWHL